MLASFYIQRQLSKTLGLSVNAEEIFYQVDDRESDYVNTDMVLSRDRLLSVMQFMLDEVSLNPDLREKCRQAERILTLWIRGLDALATVSEDMSLLPGRFRNAAGGLTGCYRETRRRCWPCRMMRSCV